MAYIQISPIIISRSFSISSLLSKLVSLTDLIATAIFSDIVSLAKSLEISQVLR
ncbi:MAG: hypothetical protein ACI9X8_000509 [Pseudoalteromonas distincta]|jgi:hypothetical protein